MMYGAQVPKLSPEWSSGLCSCFEDFDVCLYGTFCTGCQLMQIRQKLDNRKERESDTCIGCLLTVGSMYVLGWLFHGLFNLRTREKISEEYNYRDECSCLKSFCCLWCSTCQMAREIKHLDKMGTIGRVPEIQNMK